MSDLNGKQKGKGKRKKKKEAFEEVESLPFKRGLVVAIRKDKMV